MQTNLFNVIAEVKLSYKPDPSILNSIMLSNSELAKEMFITSWDVDQIGFRECFKVMLLNRANKVLGIMTVSEGGQTSTIVDPKIILQAAILSHSASVILCHNHPSGRTEPSDSDIRLTSKVKQGLQLFDITLLDHLIISPTGASFSFADNGNL